MNKKAFLALALITIATLACSFSFGNSGTTTTSSDGALYQDDFSNNGSGWPKDSYNGNVMDYANGQYRIYVADTYGDLIANAGVNLPADVVIDVDITLGSGSENNDFGVVCRLQDLDNFYFFQISSDGYAVIGMFQDNSMYYLSADAMQKVDGIYSGNATNHVRAVCQGSNLTLYANNALVASVSDTTFTSGGDVGLMGGSFDQGGIDIYFDDFVVTAP